VVPTSTIPSFMSPAGMSSWDKLDFEGWSNEVVDCRICLDLNADCIIRRRRSHGVFQNFPHSFSPEALSRSLQGRNCIGCHLIHKAVCEIKRRFDFGFEDADVVLEYLHGDEIQDLSISLRVFSSYKTLGDKREKLLATEGLDIELRRGLSLNSSDADYRISTPSYEVFSPGQPTSTSLGEITRVSQISCSAVHIQPHRSEDTSSDRAVKWTLHQLDTCGSDHLECRDTDQTWSLPKRVLNLGEDVSLGADIALYVTAGEQKDYVCLSYCWGPTDGSDVGLGPLETTKWTLESFQCSIPWEQLPKTFQDAVVFTRKLGFRYLWIDALCIIQDSVEDWTQEAGEMANIFKNATLTLAAASSSNSAGGLFRKNKTTTEICAELGMETMDGTAFCIREFPNPDFFAYTAVDQPFRGKVSPLMKRGWAFQERHLSQRVVYFTPQQLVWECRLHADSESGYPGIDTTLKNELVRFKKSSSSQEELTEYWHTLVTKFSYLKLSYKKDMLPAMAGVAKSMVPFFGTQYHAGLWRDTFIPDLLWRRDMSVFGGDPRRVADERDSSRGPSWSWSSNNAAKTFVKCPLITNLCTVEDVTCTSKAGDLFVQVDSGCCVVLGYLISLKGQDSMCTKLNRN